MREREKKRETRKRDRGSETDRQRQNNRLTEKERVRVIYCVKIELFLTLEYKPRVFYIGKWLCYAKGS